MTASNKFVAIEGALRRQVATVLGLPDLSWRDINSARLDGTTVDNITQAHILITECLPQLQVEAIRSELLSTRIVQLQMLANIKSFDAYLSIVYLDL